MRWVSLLVSLSSLSPFATTPSPCTDGLFFGHWEVHLLLESWPGWVLCSVLRMGSTVVLAGHSGLVGRLSAYRKAVLYAMEPCA